MSTRRVFFNKTRTVDAPPSTTCNLNENTPCEKKQSSPPSIKTVVEIPVIHESDNVDNTTTTKKKLILRKTKRTTTKKIYNGPRKIFSTSYKANRAQLNHKDFFGAEEFEFDDDKSLSPAEEKSCSQPNYASEFLDPNSEEIGRTTMVKSKSVDSLSDFPSTSTITTRTSTTDTKLSLYSSSETNSRIGVSNTRTTVTSTATRVIENGKMKIVCPRNQKNMFTVVPNIRQPTTCEELGETQSYIDDMEYLLAGFESTKLLDDRCLSAVKFAEKCANPNFRMHLRTKSALDKVFELLADAPSLPFNELSFETDREYDKTRQRIQIIVEKYAQESNEIFYNERFSASDILLETFVNCTGKNLKDWLKNDIRTMGGLSSTIDAIGSIVQDLSNNDYQCYPLSEILIRYRKICRYIKMLEDLMNGNNDNREYISNYKQFSLFHSLSKLLDLSLSWMKQYCPQEKAGEGDIVSNHQITPTTVMSNASLYEVFLHGCKTMMSILVILTNESKENCKRLIVDDRFFINLFQLLVIVEKTQASDDRFDVMALALNLLINLVQNSNDIYQRLMDDDMPGITGTNKMKIYQFMAKLFCDNEASAAKAESQEENDWMEIEQDSFNPELRVTTESRENFNRALQKASHHMEHSFLAAFAGVILSLILLKDKTHVDRIRELMPLQNFNTMAFILKKFFLFMNLSNAFTQSGVKILEEIVEMLLSLC
ncbi:unnamed protein product [Didymodactylos carnosus]|uniref:WAPL domain-containing protein n=1 Tax=Didymodactylos carnosus TaxID=1234261 RepID=A0A813SF32_9BILA|nr:unnamed protein product [Didymodactylos carnosus]CAF0795401.1 unnamed protein product [Didymodactylos carnosus]CAF3516823.1 unnamed protein product [Didymodactylos carnosus]CAF3579930.1 unnamed protein product [Didymodactylos carnosus]